jgi:two-component system, NarL family, sensor histidine kinase EvgS
MLFVDGGQGRRLCSANTVRWRRVLLGLLCLVFCCVGGVTASPEYRFKTLSGSATINLAPGFLTDAERNFLAQLPEIRVAVVKVGAPPYETLSVDGEVGGFQVEVLTQLAKTLGLRLRPVVFDDWPSLLRAMRDKEADLVPTLAITPARLEYLAFTLGTVPVPAAVFAVQGSTAPTSLNKARIALERDYYSNDLVRRQYPGASIVPTLTTVEAFRAVREGRADYYVGSMLEATYFLSQEPVPGIEVRDVIQSGSVMYHFGVRKDWARLAAILNKGIARYRTDGQGSAWAATRAGMPASVALPHPLPLSDSDNALLAQHAVWRIGAVRGLAMLNEVSDNGLHTGIAAEYTEHVAARLGVGVELVPFESVGAMLDGLRKGRIDFVPFLTRTEARAKEFGFSQPYFEMPYVLVGRGDGPLYWDLGSLKGRRLALALAHPLRELLAQKYQEVRVVDAKNGNDAMDMVARGEADAAVEVKVFANLRINNDRRGLLRAFGTVEDLPAQFRFSAGKETRALLPLIDRALDEIPPNERERMLRRWVAIDFNPPFPWRRHLPVILVSGASLLLIAAGTLWWMRRLAREVKARRRADEQLDDVGRTLPGAAFRDVQDASGRIRRRFFSSGSQQFLGIRPQPDQAVIDALLPRLSATDAATLREMQERHLKDDQRLKFTGLYAHPDGRQLWLHIEAVRTRHGGDKVSTGYVVDVSTERHLQERLAKEASERHVLLASASHELRAPTHTLSLALQTLSSEGWSEPAARSLKIAKEASRTLAQLLNDVLDVARFDAGHVELRPQNFDLRALIEQIRDAHAAALAAKNLGFECNVAQDVPALLFLDPLRLKQVLTNLLSNATRYTSQGSVTLQVQMASGDGQEATRHTGAEPMLSFVVSDTGSGLSPERKAAPFVPFGRTTSSEGGTGLGLSICRRLVEMMGGSIELQSQQGVGTVATVLLPIVSRRVVPSQFRAEGVVLLCDDDPVCRMLMAEELASQGYQVEQVDGGEAALSRLRSGGVRALITDLSMPGLGGPRLIQTLRDEESRLPPPHTAVVICSGNPAPLALSQHPGLEHDVFLTKPVDVRTLVQALHGLGIAASVGPHND